MVDARSQMVRWLAALGATVRQTFALRRVRPGDFGRSILKQACMSVEYCANEKLRKVAFAFPPQRAPRGGPPSGATLFWALGRVRSGVHHHAAGQRAASGAVPTDLTRRG